MNLERPFGRRDEAAALTGDNRFLGVDERTPPACLPAGMASRAVNMRFRRGRAETRPGILVCPWMQGNGKTPWAEVYAATVFSDPNQPAEWFVIAADGAVWKTRPNMTASRVPLPANTSLNAATATMFVQCFNVLILLRGPDESPLVCTNLDVGFTAVPAHTPSEGTDIYRDMPKASFGMFYLNRLWLIEGKDVVAVSEIQSYTEFLAVASEYRINSGNTDQLLALVSMTRGTVICLKDASVLALLNARGDLSELTLDSVTTKCGLAGPLAWARNGRNLFWMSEGGHVASLALTEQNEVQDTDERLSEPLIQTFGRVHPLRVRGAAMEVWDGRLYVALPVDEAAPLGEAVATSADGFMTDYAVAVGQWYYWDGGTEATLTVGTATHTGPTWFEADKPCYAASDLTEGGANGTVYAAGLPTNNAVAIYDFANRAWCGVDEGAGVVNVRHWLKAKYQGRVRLFAIGADGVLRLYEEGFEDETIANGVITAQAIPTELVTRGYAPGDPDRKRHTALALQLRTWNPEYSIASQGPAYGSAVTHRAAVTRSATENEPHGSTAYDADNDNDDHDTAGRHDYSLDASATGWTPGSGVDVDAHQAQTERVPLDETAPWQQAIVTNARGRIEVEAAWVEAVRAERLSGTVV